MAPATETAPAAELHGGYTVWLDGKTYSVDFSKGRPQRVQVTYQTEYKSWRRNSGMRQTRWVWSTGLRYEEPNPGTVSAKLVAMIRDRSLAAKAGAKVETPDERTARYRRIDRQLAADKKAAEQAKKLAAAAPALLDALQVFLLCPETRALLDAHDPMAVKQALEAVALAEGDA